MGFPLFARVFGEQLARGFGQGGGAATGLGPANGRLSEWWASRDVYSDIAFTTPATNGGPVRGWKDQQSNRHVTTSQIAAPDRRPAYAASVALLNNRAGITFATDDVLEASMSGPLLGNLNAYGIYAVFCSATVTGEAFAEGSTASDTPFVSFRPSNAANVRSNHRDDAGLNASISPAGTAIGAGTFLVTILRTASNAFLYRKNGTQDGTTTTAPSTTSTNHLSIGGLVRTGYSLPFSGTIGYIGLYSITSNFAAVEAVLAAYYGITLP